MTHNGLDQVPLKKVEGSAAVTLYLPKEMDLETVACAWENEHFDLDRRHLTYDGDDKQVIIITLSPAQLTQLKNKNVTLLRKKVGHDIELSLNSACLISSSR